MAWHLYVIEAIILAVVLISSICYIQHWHPWIVVKIYLRSMYYFLGFKVKHVSVGGLQFSYAERGIKNPVNSSILIIHGFTAGKEDFLFVARNFAASQHVIIVDLPGHGTSSPIPEGVTLTVTTFALAVHDFVTAIGLNSAPLHIVGQSLGGGIVAVYTAIFPEDVSKLTLICPVLGNEVKTEFVKSSELLEAEQCPLIVTTVEGMRSILQLVLHRAGKLSSKWSENFCGTLKV